MNYSDLVYSSYEKPQNFYWRNQAFCDGLLFVATAIIIAAFVGVMA